MSSSKKKLTISSSRRWEESEAEDQIEAWLPDEIIYLIICKLMVFPTYLARFSVVCKRWHRIICNSWPKLVQEHQIAPLVLCPVVDLDEGRVKELSCQVYNLMEENAPVQVNSLPYGFTQIIGSSFGWLIIVTEVSDQSVSVSLFNPLSKAHIPMPRFQLHGRNLVKGVLSKPPLLEEEHYQPFDIAITLSLWTGRTTTTYIAYLHVEKIEELESRAWAYRDGDEILDVNSIAGKICILYANGIISCLKWRTYRFCHYHYGVRTKLLVLGGVLPESVYLLESSSSQPLVVIRHNRCEGIRTVAFKIFTLTSKDEEINGLNKTWNWTKEDANTKKMMERAQQQQHLNVLSWTEIKTLGNDVIFLSNDNNGDSICIQAAGSKAGSIYFLNDYNPQGLVGVFNLDQNCSTYFSHGPDEAVLLHRKFPYAFWIMPNAGILKFSSTG